MRVITGKARGMKLKTLDSSEIRPTTDRVKEAIFSIIQFDVEGRMVLDLFAGSGQMGIEALSRGARRAVFVDNHAPSVNVLRENLAHTRMEGDAQVAAQDFASYLHTCGERFDIAFLDPPYHKGLLKEALPLTAAVMNPGGTIVCESWETDELPPAAGDFVIYREYRYGKVLVTVYRCKEGT